MKNYRSSLLSSFIVCCQLSRTAHSLLVVIYKAIIAISMQASARR